MPRLIKNAIQCAKCKDVIESVHRHDFKFCKCGAVYVDGGREYIRCGGDFNDIIDLCEWESTDEIVNKEL